MLDIRHIKKLTRDNYVNLTNELKQKILTAHDVKSKFIDGKLHAMDLQFKDGESIVTDWINIQEWNLCKLGEFLGY